MIIQYFIKDYTERNKELLLTKMPMQHIISVPFLIFDAFIHFMQLGPAVLEATNVEDDEFNLFLFTLLILGLIFVGLCILIGILLTLISLLAIFGFIAIGTLSASAIVGIHKKSVTTGFRTFVVLFSTLTMTFLGAVSFWILNRISHWWSSSTAIISGMVIGFISGLIVGIIVAYLIKILSAYLKKRIEIRKGEG